MVAPIGISLEQEAQLVISSFITTTFENDGSHLIANKKPAACTAGLSFVASFRFNAPKSPAATAPRCW
jgi:hypothetical protein